MDVRRHPDWGLAPRELMWTTNGPHANRILKVGFRPSSLVFTMPVQRTVTTPGETLICGPGYIRFERFLQDGFVLSEVGTRRTEIRVEANL